MAEQFTFVEAETAITDIKEIIRWQAWVKTQVRIGIELEKAGNAPLYILERELEPSHSYGILSRYNVVNITHDGSVNGDGNEILVCGTIEPFIIALEKMEELHKILRGHRLKADASCGMHYHILAAQNSFMPEVILKNFYQLFRFYYAGLLYLTSTGTASSRTSDISRGSTQYFSSAHVGITPVGRTMSSVKARINGQSGRYSAFNMGDELGGRHDLMRFNGENQVVDFHVELRFPDASDAPAQIVAQMFMFRAMLLKAIELSKFGVITARADETPSTRQVADRLVNGTVQPSDLEYAKDQAQRLLTLIRPNLLTIDGSSAKILGEMIRHPVWKLRKGGVSWADINNGLLPRERVVKDIAQVVLKTIVLQQVTGAKTAQLWKGQAATFLGLPENEIRNGLIQLGHQVKLGFDLEAGTYYVEW